MHQTGAHAAQSHRGPLLIGWLVPEVKIIHVAIISNAVTLDSVFWSLVLSTGTRMDRRTLYLARLLVN